MKDIFDYSDTSDVSDEAIQYVLDGLGRGGGVHDIRNYAVKEYPYHKGYHYSKSVIALARMIQKHEPDRPVDKATRVAREICAEHWDSWDYPDMRKKYIAGKCDGDTDVKVAKAAYLKGLEDARND